ncbi:hypothetical protein L7F22_008857 [Adiantum nelumboides]|nr:hypothetical protein [Adiantum nelumboides]
MAFSNFFGKQYESASNFLDDLEMAFLVSGRDEEEVKLRAFPLVLKDSAKNWFQNLEPGRKTNWETVKETFLSKYGGLDNPEHLWHRISSLHQATSRTYLTYESQFLRLWAEWEASLAEGERAPNFLKKEKFLAGLFPDLQEKVKGKFPETFEEALQIARVKDRKLEYQAHTSRVEHPQGPTMADERLPPAPTTTPEDPHLELLQRVTNQLDNLSINMVQGVRQQQPQPNNERMPNGPRRQPQRRDYFSYNCGEEGHGMYFCPHPRNFNAQAGRGRQQVTPPRARPPPQIQPQILQNPQMVAQPQVLQRSEAPQPVAEIPPLPNNNAHHKKVKEKGKSSSATINQPKDAHSPSTAKGRPPRTTKGRPSTSKKRPHPAVSESSESLEEQFELLSQEDAEDSRHADSKQQSDSRSHPSGADLDDSKATQIKPIHLVVLCDIDNIRRAICDRRVPQEWPIGTFTTVGDALLDCLAGYGGMATECERLHRHCISIEKDVVVFRSLLFSQQRFPGEVGRVLHYGHFLCSEELERATSLQSPVQPPIPHFYPPPTPQPPGIAVALWSIVPTSLYFHETPFRMATYHGWTAPLQRPLFAPPPMEPPPPPGQYPPPPPPQL